MLLLLRNTSTCKKYRSKGRLCWLWSIKHDKLTMKTDMSKSDISSSCIWKVKQPVKSFFFFYCSSKCIEADYFVYEFLTSQTDDIAVAHMDAGSTTAEGAAVRTEQNVEMKPGSNEGKRVHFKLHPINSSFVCCWDESFPSPNIPSAFITKQINTTSHINTQTHNFVHKLSLSIRAETNGHLLISTNRFCGGSKIVKWHKVIRTSV